MKYMSVAGVTATQVRVIAAVVVIVGMVFSIYQGDIINRDGILYLRVAMAYLDGGILAAMGVYSWPAYPLMIAEVSRWAGVSLEISAWLLNGVCLLVLVDSFVRLAHMLDGRGKPWVPVLVLLSLPVLRHRLDIIRDWGYLAFSLRACVPLLRFWQEERGSIKNALGWLVFMMIAFAFRIEAAGVVLLTAPIFLMQRRSWHERLRSVGMIVGVWLVPCILLVVIIGAGNITSFGRMAELFARADLAHSFAGFDAHVSAFAENVLNKYSDDAAAFMLGSAIVAMIFRMILSNLGPALLVVLALVVRKLKGVGDDYLLIFGLLVANVLILCVFLFNQIITVNRYALLGSLFLMLFVSRGVSCLYESGNQESLFGKWRARLVFVGLVMMVLVNTHARPDAKEYVREVGVWLSRNVPIAVEVVANDERILYYAGRAPGSKLDTLEKLRDNLRSASPPYYAALRFDNRDIDRVRSLVGLEPIKIYMSKRANERAEIYYVPAAH